MSARSDGYCSRAVSKRKLDDPLLVLPRAIRRPWHHPHRIA